MTALVAAIRGKRADSVGALEERNCQRHFRPARAAAGLEGCTRSAETTRVKSGCVFPIPYLTAGVRCGLDIVSSLLQFGVPIRAAMAMARARSPAVRAGTPEVAAFSAICCGSSRTAYQPAFFSGIPCRTHSPLAVPAVWAMWLAKWRNRSQLRPPCVANRAAPATAGRL
jgi:hypothetical protein